jgi:serine/threonine protein kinase
MIGQTIVNYKIISRLGQGGMATVYLAHDLKFDTNVALKVLNKEFVYNENIRKRFLAEAKNMYRMSHANVVKVTDLIDENDNVSFVMEYIDGETLKDYIERKGRLSDDEIRTILLQMLQALIYVHNHNLIHRDIKPSNFMIDKLGRVKLMDFGIAKNTDSNSAEYTQTGTGLQMGTPMYMSPEQIRSTKEVNHLTDIYSVGVVLWHLVMGHKPYNADTLSSFDLQAKIVNEPLPKTQTFWDEMIQKATEKKSESRFKSCELWIKELHEQKNNSIFSSDHGQSTIVENKVLDNGKKNTKEKGDNQSFESKNTINEENHSTKHTISLSPLTLLSKKNFVLLGLTLVLLVTEYFLLKTSYEGEMNSAQNSIISVEDELQIATLSEYFRGFARKSEISSTAADKFIPKKQKKAKYYLAVIDDIDKMTAERIKMIDDIKIKILAKCGEDVNSIGQKSSIIFKKYSYTDPLLPMRLHLENIAEKFAQKEVKSLMLNNEINNPDPSALGMKLWNSYNDYRNELTECIANSWMPDGGTSYFLKAPKINNYKDFYDLNNQIDKAIKASNVNNADIDVIKKIFCFLTKQERGIDNVHWLGMTFGNSSTIEALAALSILQKQILTARADALELIRERVGGSEYSVNTIAAFVSGPEVVYNEDQLEFDVFVAAFDSNQNPIVTINQGVVENVNNGVARINSKLNKGTNVIKGTISYTNSFGSMRTLPWQKKVIVRG